MGDGGAPSVCTELIIPFQKPRKDKIHGDYLLSIVGIGGLGIINYYLTRDPVTQKDPNLIDTYGDMHNKLGEWVHEKTVRKEDEPHSKKLVAVLQAKRQNMLPLKKIEMPQQPLTKEKRKEKALPPKMQRRPMELQNFFRRLSKVNFKNGAGLTIEAEEGVFGPGITYVPLNYNELLLLMTQGWLDSQIIAGPEDLPVRSTVSSLSSYVKDSYAITGSNLLVDRSHHYIAHQQSMRRKTELCQGIPLPNLYTNK